MVAHELLDYNLPKALSKNLNYFLKELEFTDKKGSKRMTSFVCMESLASMVEIIQRKNLVDAIASNPWCL